MKILVVEDDQNKARQVSDFLREYVPAAEVSEARSYQSGLKASVQSRPELIVLDMSMPTYDITASEPGGRPKAFAGRDILRELTRKRIDTKVVIVTQFERFGEGDETTTLAELKAQLDGLFGDRYLGTVSYHPAKTEWRDELARLISHVAGR